MHVRSESYQPEAGVKVLLSVRDAGGELVVEEAAETGEDGTVRFDGLPPGDYAFQAFGGAFRRTQRTAGVEAGGEAAVEIPLLPFDGGGGGR